MIADTITDIQTQRRGKLEPGGKDRNICNNLAAKRRTHGPKDPEDTLRHSDHHENMMIRSNQTCFN